MGTSQRLLRLLSLLQTPRDWTGAELAQRLEVSPRTIRNDIERRRPGSTVDPSVLTELARLARQHFTLRFDYSDRRETASQRRVEPYRIVNAGPRWYLVAWDLDRRDWRTFRVDRMRP